MTSTGLTVAVTGPTGDLGLSIVDAGSGKDRVYSDEGDVTVAAGPGNDIVIAGGGRAVVDGRAGDDRIRTGPFDDQVTGGFGADSIDTGAGNDQIKVKDKKRDRVQCGPGQDSVIADGADLLIGCEDVHTRGARIG